MPDLDWTPTDHAAVEHVIGLIKREGSPLMSVQKDGVLICKDGKWHFGATLGEAVSKSKAVR